MLLLPYSDKSVVRSFPVVTTLLVLVCTVVLFAFQSRDALREQRAFEYYHESGLDKIELPRYEEYLASSNDAEATERLRLLHRAEPGSPATVQLIQSDTLFQRALHAKRIVREDETGFGAWSAERQQFDSLLGSTVQARYSLARAQVAEVWRFVSYSFLHGGIAHWLGNMVVLVLVGPFVEAALGRLRFAAAYLAGGAAAGALHVIVSDSAVIGASGAIAATIGMLAVLYGTRKVPVFYWIFIVFGTAQIPALA
ncbi:MAG TPA: rhomboid family intramembrane serine protease, partial [Burkholderiaceae bacterium]|nr:rhomboid family intramembrane serine protease [Burkholderiaceae bacterium]